MHRDLNTVFLHILVAVVVDAVDIIDADALEDILDAESIFHIWLIAHLVGDTIARELEEVGIQRCAVGSYSRWVVLARDVANDATETRHLTPLESLEERNAVEHPAIEEIDQIPRGIAVIDKLWMVYEGLALGMQSMVNGDCVQSLPAMRLTST